MLEDCCNAVVGVSGGADSVCLMLMLNDYIIHNNKDVKLHIVHVNHGIRKKPLMMSSLQESCVKVLSLIIIATI